MPRSEAIAYFKEKDEPYKVELIEDLPEDSVISFYSQGEFTDLCAGPHLMSTKPVKAFKLTSLAGAYWRGSEKNKMLQIKKSHFLNSDSPAGYLESIVAQIATDTKIARTFESNYSSIETIIDKQRMSISGVDRDEEAMNLVKYKNAYELSSKMIQVLTEIYDRLILETGV